jgi:sugar phosphate isomerase/epimerase
MLIGAMNHPAADVLREIEWMAELNLDFVDLTLEPPAAAAWRVDAGAIRVALERHHIDVVGHTAFYLPLASPFESIRKAAVEELRHCLEIFSRVGAKVMNLHPDRHAPMHDRSFYIAKNIQSIRELLPYSKDYGVELMIENLPGDFNNAQQLGEILDAVPEVGLHLDIGHANLLVPFNTTEEILAKYGSRLLHVHLHDNKGGHADLHLPLGAGNVDVRRSIRALQAAGFDGTITLEVFTPDRNHFIYSRDLLRKVWQESSVYASAG